jgi:ABC-type branched-subunit amino acid transport system permease subunit
VSATVAGAAGSRASTNGSAGGRDCCSSVVAAFVYGEFIANGNINFAQTGFNVVLYALLALGLNIVVGWAGLLDLGYIAFFGAGAYVYAMFSSHAFGNLAAGTGGVILPAVASIPIVSSASRCSAC